MLFIKKQFIILFPTLYQTRLVSYCRLKANGFIPHGGVVDLSLHRVLSETTRPYCDLHYKNLCSNLGEPLTGS